MVDEVLLILSNGDEDVVAGPSGSGEREDLESS